MCNDPNTRDMAELVLESRIRAGNCNTGGRGVSMRMGRQLARGDYYSYNYSLNMELSGTRNSFDIHSTRAGPNGASTDRNVILILGYLLSVMMVDSGSRTNTPTGQ